MNSHDAFRHTLAAALGRSPDENGTDRLMADLVDAKEAAKATPDDGEHCPACGSPNIHLVQEHIQSQPDIGVPGGTVTLCYCRAPECGDCNELEHLYVSDKEEKEIRSNQDGEPQD